MNRHIRRALAALAATAAIIGTTATPGAAAYPYYKVVNRHSNQCLEIAGGSSESGWWAQQWPCFGGEHQIWRIPLFTSVRQIVVRHTGFCLTALGGYAFQMPCNGTVNQNWDKTLLPGTVGIYEFRSALNGHCLQVENRSTVEGELVGLATCTGAACQQWQLL